MDCLVNLIGTGYDQVGDFLKKYEKDGFIWFLESCDLTVMAMRRAIWQMKHAGWFEHVKGFLIGRPLHFGEEAMGLDHYRAVVGAFGRISGACDYGYGFRTSASRDAHHVRSCGVRCAYRGMISPLTTEKNRKIKQPGG